MTGALIVQLVVPIINGVFAVGVLAVGVKMNRKIREVRHQVTNDHDTNMRDENDERYTESKHKLDGILGEILILSNSVNRVWMRLDNHNEKIQNLETPQPTREREQND